MKQYRFVYKTEDDMKSYTVVTSTLTYAVDSYTKNVRGAELVKMYIGNCPRVNVQYIDEECFSVTAEDIEYFVYYDEIKEKWGVDDAERSANFNSAHMAIRYARGLLSEKLAKFELVEI